jgi:hypothetical protein
MADQNRQFDSKIDNLFKEQSDSQELGSVLAAFKVFGSEDESLRNHALDAAIRAWDENSGETRVAAVQKIAADFERYAASNAAAPKTEFSPPPPAGSSGAVSHIETPAAGLYDKEDSSEDIVKKSSKAVGGVIAAFTDRIKGAGG